MNKRKLHFILAVVMASFLIAGALTFFVSKNGERVTDYNRSYLVDSTERKAAILDKEIASGYANIQLLSRLVSNSLNKPEFDVADIRHFVKDSVFDFMEFADREGMDHNVTGGVSDARDRQYFLDAKEGNTGMELIYESRATHETLMMFYSPLYYKETFVGSLVGVYQADNRISKILDHNFFGSSADAYLVSPEGKVISCSKKCKMEKGQDIAKLLGEDDAAKAELMQALRSEGTSLISVPGSDVGGCVVKLPRSGYYMVNVFPQAAYKQIVTKSSSQSFKLIAFLVVIFALFIIFLIRFFVDEQKQLNEAKIEAEVARKQAERANAAKTTFLFNMSHDIRTPMNAITGFTELLKRNLDDKELAKSYLTKIDTANSFLLSLINNILELARIESGKVTLNETPVNIYDNKSNIYALFEPQLKKKNMEFESHVNVEHTHLFVDETKLREVLLNLISNAVKYTPAGGKISLFVDELPCDYPGHALIRTIIKDTGIGMSKDYLPHIFEEFTREKTSTESKVIGTGLGMPIVKKLVEMMGGEITVDSELGKGTTFTIIVKHRIANPVDMGPEENTDNLLSKVDFKGKRILLAEDNDLNAEIASTLLEDAGFFVERAEDGSVCLDMLKKAEAGYYDIILMDIQMPVLDGYATTEKIRKLPDASKANTLIVAMTANAFEEDRQKALSVGMNGHLAKPIEIDKLIATLSMMIKR